MHLGEATLRERRTTVKAKRRIQVQPLDQGRSNMCPCWSNDSCAQEGVCLSWLSVEGAVGDNEKTASRREDVGE